MDETTSTPSHIKSTLTDYEVMRKSVGSTPSELRAELRAQLSRAQLSKSAAIPADHTHCTTSSSVAWTPTTSSTTFTLTNSKFTSPHSYITTTSSTTSTLTSSNSSLTPPYSYTTTLSGSVCTTSTKELADQMEAEQIDENIGKESRTQKPPPINIEDVSNVTLMEAELDKVLGSSNYTYHFSKRGAARVQVEDSDAYRRLVKFLKENNAHHYSYQLKEDKAFKVIVRNLASTTPHNKIKEAFTQHGHNVLRLYNPPARKLPSALLRAINHKILKTISLDLLRRYCSSKGDSGGSIVALVTQ
ncbi:hypothetical protein ACLKA7_007465 [Drosophila subpalustris]